ncbi:MAG: DNA-protecting protein DprA [Candidatus Methylopumilus sp.]|jgi:DNA processing protein|nr:DNA-protecting protein DprA [Candidatus Methylopumilus sp.]
MRQVPQDCVYWLRMHEIQGLGRQTTYQLLKAFGSAEAIFAASHANLRKVVSDDIANQIKAETVSDQIKITLEWLAEPNNHLITLADEDYPRLLLETPDPPPILFAKGQLSCLQQPSIAIVGSRNPTAQGEKNAHDFAMLLAEFGFTIVSGLAIGIDAAAHRGALASNGKTIAVVGTGLDIVYPAKHRELAHEIIKQGLLISEFSLGTPSLPQNFVQRNRVISGLSMGCLVVEASLQSGSLITAKFATEQDRDVFAIPGSIHSPQSKGCHQLIKQGAKLVDAVQDIVHELKSEHFVSLAAIPLKKNFIPAKNTSPEEIPHADKALLDLMSFEPVTVEYLLQHSGLTSDTLSSILISLELDNKIASMPGGRYQRIV